MVLLMFSVPVFDTLKSLDDVTKLLVTDTTSAIATDPADRTMLQLLVSIVSTPTDNAQSSSTTREPIRRIDDTLSAIPPVIDASRTDSPPVATADVSPLSTTTDRVPATAVNTVPAPPRLPR